MKWVLVADSFYIIVVVVVVLVSLNCPDTFLYSCNYEFFKFTILYPPKLKAKECMFDTFSVTFFEEGESLHDTTINCRPLQFTPELNDLREMIRTDITRTPSMRLLSDRTVMLDIGGQMKEAAQMVIKKEERDPLFVAGMHMVSIRCIMTSIAANNVIYQIVSHCHAETFNIDEHDLAEIHATFKVLPH